MKLRTPQQAKEALERKGVSVAAWSVANGFNPNLVHMVLSGARKPTRGQTHNIAVKLGINPVHFGILIDANMEIGLCHPPVGLNIFIIKNGALFTPPLAAGALYGITRQTVIELAEQTGMKVSEPNLTRYDLFCADECFITGTAAEIVPVVKIDGRVIGTGKPGPLTLKFSEKYHALTKASGEPIYQ